MAPGINSTALAYIGDAVFELRMRCRLLQATPEASAAVLHKRNSKLVCAKAQSELIQVLKTYLTEEELGVYRRGRNAHPGTVPKNQSMSDYRRATGFEALIGYLYLEGREQRIDELIETGFNLWDTMNQ